MRRPQGNVPESPATKQQQDKFEAVECSYRGQRGAWRIEGRGGDPISGRYVLGLLLQARPGIGRRGGVVR